MEIIRDSAQPILLLNEKDNVAVARLPIAAGTAVIVNGYQVAARENIAPGHKIALKPIPPAGVCEMKRLFVRPEFRGMHLGSNLARYIVEEARTIGYSVMRLDTIRGKMDNAIELYESIGFKEIPAYYHNPVPNAFFMELKLAAFGALCVSFPLVAGQIWAFVAPGLYKNERQAFLPFLVATPIMFIVGATFFYVVILPLAIKFFASFQMPGGADVPTVMLQPKIGEYISFVMTLIFAFGLCFELLEGSPPPGAWDPAHPDV